jgi:hypothetical protein
MIQEITYKEYNDTKARTTSTYESEYQGIHEIDYFFAEGYGWAFIYDDPHAEICLKFSPPTYKTIHEFSKNSIRNMRKILFRIQKLEKCV